MAAKIAVIRRLSDGVALIQWHDKKGALRRGYVPAAIAHDPSNADLKAAVPFGDLDEGEWPRLVVTPQRVLAILKKKGLWTKKQLDQSPHLLRDAYTTATLQVLRKWESEHTGQQEVKHG